MEEYFIINDIGNYAKNLRHLVASHLKENYTENLDEYISLEQLQTLILEKCQNTDDSGNILISEELNEEIFNATCDWIYGVGLSKLASENLIECAWDDEQNCMVFWATENMEKSDEPKRTTNNRDKTDY